MKELRLKTKENLRIILRDQIGTLVIYKKITLLILVRNKMALISAFL
jgi:hypothetical protein